MTVKNYQLKMLALALSILSTGSFAQDPLDGEALFRTAGGYGCATCHGMYAEGGGNAGGNIRGKSMEAMDLAFANEPTMTLLSSEMTKEKREAIVQYLVELNEYALVEWVIESDQANHSFELAANELAQLVITNKTFEPIELFLDAVGGSTIYINPYETKSYEWSPNAGKITLQHQSNVLMLEVN